MSFKHKSRAKREKEFKKLCKAVYIIVELFNKIHKIEEKNYPKLAPGGMVYGQCNLQGGEMIVPYTGFKGATPYENEPYLFQFNS